MQQFIASHANGAAASWCWTSMPRMCRCTARRSAAPSTPTTTTTATCRCTSSAGQDLLACVLRPSDRDPASVVSALIKRLMVPLRQAWPKYEHHRAGATRASAARVCCAAWTRWGVTTSSGCRRTRGCCSAVELAELALAEQYAVRGTKQRMFGEFELRGRQLGPATARDRPAGARSARCQPALHRHQPRRRRQALYEQRYCARGEAENRIKEAQLDLFGRRASCHRFAANQLRLLLAALAYTLMINLRRLALKGTELAQACTATIRTKLLKIGAAIVRNTRRVRVLLASSHPLKHVFRHRGTRARPHRTHPVPVPGTLTNNGGKGAVRLHTGKDPKSTASNALCDLGQPPVRPNRPTRPTHEISGLEALRRLRAREPVPCAHRPAAPAGRPRRHRPQPGGCESTLRCRCAPPLPPAAIAPGAPSSL